MARSADALQRRAQKRGRDLQEQQTADANAAAKDRTNNKKLTTEKGQEVSQALTEPGAWKCPSCGNHNFSSRYICNSKTCDETKPESAVRASQASRGGALGPKSWSTASRPPPNKKPKRHDPETSKVIDWSKPQASASQIEHNQLLRQRLKDNDPTLVGEELERAQILVARDARKEQKKKVKPTKRERKQQRKANNTNTDQTASIDANEAPPTKTEEDDKKELTSQPPKLSKKEQQKANKLLLKQLEDTQGKGMTEEALKRANELQNRKANKALMKKFQTTRGKGMSPDEKTRAQNLISRKERKHQRRVQEQQQQQQQQGEF